MFHAIIQSGIQESDGGSVGRCAGSECERAGAGRGGSAGVPLALAPGIPYCRGYGARTEGKEGVDGRGVLRILSDARGLSASELGVLLRREGLHATDLVAWQTAAEAALSAPKRRATPTPESRRIQELERELRRKDAALAETAALLVLKKKVQEIWGDGDDSTPPRHES